MQPWRVSVGLTATSSALVVILFGSELRYLKPYWRVILAEHWLAITWYGGLGVLTLAFLFYVGARSLGLADLGRKTDVVERSIRRGEAEPELGKALGREAEGKFH